MDNVSIIVDLINRVDIMDDRIKVKRIYAFIKKDYPEFYNTLENREQYKEVILQIKQFLEAL